MKARHALVAQCSAALMQQAKALMQNAARFALMRVQWQSDCKAWPLATGSGCYTAGKQ